MHDDQYGMEANVAGPPALFSFSNFVGEKYVPPQSNAGITLDLDRHGLDRHDRSTSLDQRPNPCLSVSS